MVMFLVPRSWMRWAKSSGSSWHPLYVEMVERVPKQVIQLEFLGPYERALTGSAPSCKAYVLHICSFTDHFVLQMVVFDWYRAWRSSKSSFIVVKWNLDYFAGLKQSFFAEHFTNSLIYRTEYSIRNIQVVCSITIKRANVWAVHLSIRIATS